MALIDETDFIFQVTKLQSSYELTLGKERTSGHTGGLISVEPRVFTDVHSFWLLFISVCLSDSCKPPLHLWCKTLLLSVSRHWSTFLCEPSSVLHLVKVLDPPSSQPGQDLLKYSVIWILKDRGMWKTRGQISKEPNGGRYKWPKWRVEPHRDRWTWALRLREKKTLMFLFDATLCSPEIHEHLQKEGWGILAGGQV